MYCTIQLSGMCIITQCKSQISVSTMGKYRVNQYLFPYLKHSILARFNSIGVGGMGLF